MSAHEEMGQIMPRVDRGWEMRGAKILSDCVAPRTGAGCGMAVEKELATSRGDENFRKGACHGARWLLETSRTLAAQGRSGPEISEHLVDLVGVLADWRSQASDLPDGNPWDWSFKDLASVIKARKEK